jgi:hypothetical protein
VAEVWSCRWPGRVAPESRTTLQTNGCGTSVQRCFNADYRTIAGPVVLAAHDFEKHAAEVLVATPGWRYEREFYDELQGSGAALVAYPARRGQWGATRDYDTEEFMLEVFVILWKGS